MRDTTPDVTEIWREGPGTRRAERSATRRVGCFRATPSPGKPGRLLHRLQRGLPLGPWPSPHRVTACMRADQGQEMRRQWVGCIKTIHCPAGHQNLASRRVCEQAGEEASCPQLTNGVANHVDRLLQVRQGAEAQRLHVRPEALVLDCAQPTGKRGYSKTLTTVQWPVHGVLRAEQGSTS